MQATFLILKAWNIYQLQPKSIYPTFFLKTFVEKVSSTTHLSSFFSRLLLRAKWAYFSRHICLLRRVHLLENNTKKHYTFFTNNNLLSRFFKTWFIVLTCQTLPNPLISTEGGLILSWKSSFGKVILNVNQIWILDLCVIDTMSPSKSHK